MIGISVLRVIDQVFPLVHRRHVVVYCVEIIVLEFFLGAVVGVVVRPILGFHIFRRQAKESRVQRRQGVTATEPKLVGVV